MIVRIEQTTEWVTPRTPNFIVSPDGKTKKWVGEFSEAELIAIGNAYTEELTKLSGMPRVAVRGPNKGQPSE